MKFQKKPVVIDAWPIGDLLDAARAGAEGLPTEVREAYTKGTIEFEPEHILIATMEGVMVGRRGWHLIRGTEGEWYPCEDDAFQRTFKPLPDSLLGVPSVPTPYDSSPEV
jgi:hypothetical protein